MIQRPSLPIYGLAAAGVLSVWVYLLSKQAWLIKVSSLKPSSFNPLKKPFVFNSFEKSFSFQKAVLMRKSRPHSTCMKKPSPFNLMKKPVPTHLIWISRPHSPYEKAVPIQPIRKKPFSCNSYKKPILTQLCRKIRSSFNPVEKTVPTQLNRKSRSHATQMKFDQPYLFWKKVTLTVRRPQQQDHIWGRRGPCIKWGGGGGLCYKKGFTISYYLSWF